MPSGPKKREVYRMTRICGAVAVSFLSVAAVYAGSHSNMAEEVVMDHLRGYGALDVDMMMAPFAEDAKVITPERIYSGADEIREYFETLVAEFSQPGISMETHALIFEGDTALVTWSAESPQNTYTFASDTYVVEDGKIVTNTSAGLISAK